MRTDLTQVVHHLVRSGAKLPDRVTPRVDKEYHYTSGEPPESVRKKTFWTAVSFFLVGTAATALLAYSFHVIRVGQEVALRKKADEAGITSSVMEQDVEELRRRFSLSEKVVDTVLEAGAVKWIEESTADDLRDRVSLTPQAVWFGAGLGPGLAALKAVRKPLWMENWGEDAPDKKNVLQQARGTLQKAAPMGGSPSAEDVASLLDVAATAPELRGFINVISAYAKKVKEKPEVTAARLELLLKRMKPEDVKLLADQNWPLGLPNDEWKKALWVLSYSQNLEQVEQALWGANLSREDFKSLSGRPDAGALLSNFLHPGSPAALFIALQPLQQYRLIELAGPGAASAKNKYWFCKTTPESNNSWGSALSCTVTFSR